MSIDAKQIGEQILQKIRLQKYQLEEKFRNQKIKNTKLNEDQRNLNSFKKTMKMLFQSRLEQEVLKIQQMQIIRKEFSNQDFNQNVQLMKYENEQYSNKIIDLMDKIQIEKLRCERIRRELSLSKKMINSLQIKRLDCEDKCKNSKQLNISSNNWTNQIKCLIQQQYGPISNGDFGLLNNSKFSEYIYKKLIQLKSLYFCQKSTESELKNKKMHYEVMKCKDKSANKNIDNLLTKIGITEDEIDDQIIEFNQQINRISQQIIRQQQIFKFIQQKTDETILNECKQKSIAQFKKLIKNKQKLVHQLLQRANPLNQKEEQQIDSIKKQLWLLDNQVKIEQ